MPFYKEYSQELLASAVVLATIVILRLLVYRLVRRFSSSSQILEHRSNLVIKYINLLINILSTIALIIIWGVKKDDIFLTISSITTVVGVALFAQWSILSNITSGVILFFFFPFRIGDTIKIHDKDFPVQGEIEDINAFHINLKTATGEKMTYPNNLLLQKGITIISDTFNDQEFTD